MSASAPGCADLAEEFRRGVPPGARRQGGTSVRGEQHQTFLDLSGPAGDVAHRPINLLQTIQRERGGAVWMPGRRGGFPRRVHGLQLRFEGRPQLVDPGLECLKPVEVVESLLHQRDSDHGGGCVGLSLQEGVEIPAHLADFDEEFHRARRNALDVLRLGTRFEFVEVEQAIPGFAQRVVGGIQLGMPRIGGLRFRVACAVDAVRVRSGQLGEDAGLEGVGIQPRKPGLAEKDERIGHALKLSPQEQLVAALGFFTLKPPSVRAST